MYSVNVYTIKVYIVNRTISTSYGTTYLQHTTKIVQKLSSIFKH